MFVAEVVIKRPIDGSGRRENDVEKKGVGIVGRL